jgi:8-oxo-dGTP pyrophosphatase MutT (NUDIX family)
MTPVEDTEEHWPVTAQAELLRNHLISVRNDQVRMPAGNIAERTVVTHPGAVAIVALDDDNRILMNRQYRHPVGRLLWEIPAGLRDVAGESPLLAAQRELAEEASCQAEDWRVLVDFFSSPGYSTERLRIFLARELSEVREQNFVLRDEEAQLVRAWLPLEEAVEKALAGELHNGVTVMGILAVYASRGDFAGLRPADAPET